MCGFLEIDLSTLVHFGGWHNFFRHQSKRPNIHIQDHSAKAHWIRPFLFPTGLFGLFLYQAICQLHYQFLSITLARAAFDELDMRRRLLNVMFVNVTSVRISETLTLFFCTGEYLFLLLFLILLKKNRPQRLCSVLWSKCYRRLDLCPLFLLFQLFVCLILKSF